MLTVRTPRLAISATSCRCRQALHDIEKRGIPLGCSLVNYTKRAHLAACVQLFVWPPTRRRCCRPWSRRPHQPEHSPLSCFFTLSHPRLRACRRSRNSSRERLRVRAPLSACCFCAHTPTAPDPDSPCKSAPFHSHRAASPRSAETLTSYPPGMPQLPTRSNTAKL